MASDHINETKPLTQHVDAVTTDTTYNMDDENGQEEEKCFVDSGPQRSPKKSLRCSCPILHPYGAFKIVWDMLVSIAIVVSAIEVPLTMAFDVPVSFQTNIGIMSFCIDIFLLCDICVTFRTAYFDEWDPFRLIVSSNLIACKYLKGWFAFDFLTSFPFNFLLNYGETEEAFTTGWKILRVIRVFRLLRVFRIYKTMGIIREMNRMFPALKKWLNIAQVMGTMLFVAHYFACLWFAVGKGGQRADMNSWLDHTDPPINYDDVDSSFDVVRAYSTSMYYSIVTLFTTGYGDITAYNTYEQWVAIAIIVCGSIMTAYLIGSLTSLVFEGDKKQQYLQDKLDEAYSFGVFYGISNPLIRAITAHIEYHCGYNYVASDPNLFLANLPQHLRTEILTEIAGKNFSTIDFFQHLPQHIMGNICIQLKSIGCNAGYELFNENDLSSEIYIVRVGAARLFYGERSPLREQHSRLLTRGDVCGEFCIVSDTRENRLKCESWCEFYSLRREDLRQVLWGYMLPEEAEKYWQSMKDILMQNSTVRRHVDLRQSDKLLRSKAKTKNIEEDTVYDDLFSVKRSNALGIVEVKEGASESLSPTENERKQPTQNASAEKVSGVVDKMRNFKRGDSGYRDSQMKQHYQKLHEKGIELRTRTYKSDPSQQAIAEDDEQ